MEPQQQQNLSSTPTLEGQEALQVIGTHDCIHMEEAETISDPDGKK